LETIRNSTRKTDESASAQGAHAELERRESSRQARNAAGTSEVVSPTTSQARESDEVLVDRVRAGDRSAFNEIYGRYFKRVYAFLDRRLRNRADTEETTQEVFINIFSSIDSYRGDAPLAAWIFGLTRRTLASRFRRKRHPTVPLFEEDEEVSFNSMTAGGQPEATPLENYEMSERAQQLEHVLSNEITVEQRRLFEMHHLQSIPIAEIAKTLSKTEDSVKSGLYRTRKLLLR
jgi:RNA polymerase sigma-70 factor (ECF subfamily)